MDNRINREPDYTLKYGYSTPEPVPEPHVRQFPNSVTLRQVKVRISQYNVPGGGNHYYVTLLEEFNPVWDSRTDHERQPDFYKDPNHPIHGQQPTGWTECHTDKEGQGRSFSSGQCTFRYQVADWIGKVVAGEFPPTTHELRMAWTNNPLDIEKWSAHRGKFQYTEQGG